jgi:hypothetical protein
MDHPDRGQCLPCRVGNGCSFVWRKVAFDSVISSSSEQIEKLGGTLFNGRRSALGLVRISHHDPKLDGNKLVQLMSMAKKLDHHGWVTEIELDLRESGITDGEITVLGGLQKLRKIDLSFTRVTQKGLDELSVLYPAIQVVTNSVKFRTQ